MAIEWFCREAELGHRETQYRLAMMYYTSLGVTPDYAKTVELLSAPATQGYDPAQHLLDDIYRRGEGKGNILCRPFNLPMQLKMGIWMKL